LQSTFLTARFKWLDGLVQGESDIDRGSATADAYATTSSIHQRCPPDFHPALHSFSADLRQQKSIRADFNHYANYLVLRSQQEQVATTVTMLT